MARTENQRMKSNPLRPIVTMPSAERKVLTERRAAAFAVVQDLVEAVRDELDALHAGTPAESRAAAERLRQSRQATVNAILGE